MSKQSVVVTFGNESDPATPLSPYNYQRFPSKAPRVKGSILGIDAVEAAITSGGGKHYMYFRKDDRVEWLSLSPACATAITKGAAFTVTAEDAAPAPVPVPAPVEKPKRVRKAKPALEVVR